MLPVKYRHVVLYRGESNYIGWWDGSHFVVFPSGRYLFGVTAWAEIPSGKRVKSLIERQGGIVA